MSTSFRNSAAEAKFTRREYDRSAVALPAEITFGGQQFGARIFNLARGGAMIECSDSFPPAESFLLRCGSLAADCIVIWQKNRQYGVNFSIPLSESQMAEQLSRNISIGSREANPRVIRITAGHEPHGEYRASNAHRGVTSALGAYLSPIKASHEKVENCISELEAFMAGELKDVGAFSSARLRLRQANVARTQVVLDACGHLMKTQPDQPNIRDLQRRELDVSQMISSHVQQWTTQGLQNDWGGYCRATRKVLERVRDLIAAEKELLCP